MKPRNSIELQIWTITFGLMLAIIVLIVLVLSEGKANAEPPPGYHLVFNEEFNGPLDVAPGMGWGSGHKWLAHTPNARDFGDA